jgi:hypothetical protein
VAQVLAFKLSYDHFAGAILDFQLPVARDSVALGLSLNEMVDPKNGWLIVGISFLSCVEAEV